MQQIGADVKPFQTADAEQVGEVTSAARTNWFRMDAPRTCVRPPRCPLSYAGRVVRCYNCVYHALGIVHGGSLFSDHAWRSTFTVYTTRSRLRRSLPGLQSVFGSTHPLKSKGYMWEPGRARPAMAYLRSTATRVPAWAGIPRFNSVRRQQHHPLSAVLKVLDERDLPLCHCTLIVPYCTTELCGG